MGGSDEGDDFMGDDDDIEVAIFNDDNDKDDDDGCISFDNVLVDLLFTVVAKALLFNVVDDF